MTHGADDKPEKPSSSSDGDLAGRLSRLDEALKRRSDSTTAEGGGSRFSRADASGLARAVRLSSEFVGGVVAGGIVGWLFDRVLGTTPWGLIVFLLLGFVAGTLNVMRSAGLVKGPGGDGRGT
ncbi:AtpZ/AtpI family protein [Hansschlegelia sp. KR7-227]|jgi:ATP synthase protein I|uniref:AtpZ/AtpI family protein n=1 Tax=Hansschlegelia sp. KR7-227 TaxID=3400914 RepID=UPI003BFCDAD2